MKLSALRVAQPLLLLLLLLELFMLLQLLLLPLPSLQKILHIFVVVQFAQLDVLMKRRV